MVGGDHSFFISDFCLSSSCCSTVKIVSLRPTSLSAVSVVKRNATLFRLPEAVDVQRIPSGKATNKKRHDCLCQAFFLVAQPLTGARNWRSVSNVNRIFIVITNIQFLSKFLR